MRRDRGKMRKKVLAIVLSVAMTMSSMTAYASEPDTGQNTQTTSEESTEAAKETESSETVKETESSQTTTEESDGESVAEETKAPAKEEYSTESSSTEISSTESSETETETVTETETETVTETETETETETAAKSTKRRAAAKSAGAETYVADDYEDSNYVQYNMEGYAQSGNVTGGGLLKNVENNNYYQVDTAEAFLQALVDIKASGAKSVIEIEKDMSLGSKEIENLINAGTYKDVIAAHSNQPLMHPTLQNTGVSLLTLEGFNDLTIFSSNGSSILHCGIVIKNSSNIIIRNIVFDELWEWDEDTSGGYDRNDWDYLCFDSGSDLIWLDHCTFYKAYDGVVDVKNPADKQRITISWCKFMPGSEGNTFFDKQMDELDSIYTSDSGSLPYYTSLREGDATHDSLSKDQVRWYAYGQKKTHLFGHSNDAKSNNITVTLANNYYKNSMDRLPRLRYGTVHEYNCVLDSQELYEQKNNSKNNVLSSKITSQGAISTQEGKLLMENCYINGIKNPLYSGNGDSSRGYINQVDSVWYLNGVKQTNLAPVTSGPDKDSEETKAPLILNKDEFRAALPYKKYVRYDAEEHKQDVINNAGAGVDATENFTVAQWEATSYGTSNEGVQDQPSEEDPDKELRTEWNFKEDSSLDTTAIEGKTGTLAGLEIDATSGKFQVRANDWAIFQKGAKIKVPVKGKSKVTVTAYAAAYTVDGEAATAASQEFTCEGTDGYVVIAATADGQPYMGSIKVVPVEEDPDKELRTEWNFKEDSSLDTTAIEGKTGTLAGLEIDATSGKFQVRSGDWAIFQKGAKIKVPVKGKSKVTVTAYAAAYTVDGEAAIAASQEFICEGTDGYVVIAATADGQPYMGSIKVEPVEETGPRNIDVWDFGGMEESDMDTYTNNITSSALKEADIIGGGVFKNASNNGVSFGDLTMFYKDNDRFYSIVQDDYLSGIARSDSANYSYTSVKYDDDYTSQGGWYCNGTGDSSSRYITIQNVQAGDKIVAYMTLTSGGPSTFNFDGKDAAVVTLNDYQKYEFVADHTGTYKLYESEANSGKPMYHRIMRIPGVAVSGSIDTTTNNCTLASGYTLKFINQTTDMETEAKVNDDGTFTVTLAPGYRYLAVLSGATGYGFTDASKFVETHDTDYKDGINNVKLVVETKQVYTYSGKITGFDADYSNLSKIKVTMAPTGNSDPITLEIEDDLSFSATLLQGETYTIKLEGVDDYEITSEKTINKNADYNANITVKKKAVQKVTGGFIDIDSKKLTGLNVSKLTFTILDEAGNENSSYVYTATVANDSYSVDLREGDYIAKITLDNYSTRTHVVVRGAAVSKDLMLAAKTTTTTKIDWKANIYVGYPDKADNYATVTEALNACSRMDYTPSEEKRITIHIAPGTYREQISVTTPYISFVNDTDEEVKLTWYYGIGYMYYSSTGYYDPESAYDKYEKKIADRWGVAVYVKKDATAFRAEGITFENSFNYYVTDEELADGVEVSGTESINVVREKGTDVTSNAATERAAAIAIEADQAEFRNCGFYSSQDTLYVGEAKTHVYFTDCVIEGQTDYIFGGSDCVFDNCELSWKGYSSSSKAGYITAVRSAEGKADSGYLFRNCVVSGNEDLTVTPGYFGRPWDAYAKVVFLNTKLQRDYFIAPEGWKDMSGNKPENANFREYNTTFAGAPVDTSSRTTGTVMSAADVASINVENYLGDWTPVFYNDPTADDGKEKAVLVGADPAPGSEAVESGTKITLTATPADATIYYTLDGSDPTVSKNKQTYNKETGILLNDSDKDDSGKITVMAYASKDGYKDSDIKTFVYTMAGSAAEPAATKTLIFDELPDFAVAEGGTAGTETKINDDFSVVLHGKAKTGSSALTWSDSENTSLSKYLSTGGSVKKNSAAIKFTTSGESTVTVYWAPNGDGNGPIKILNDSGAEAAASNESGTTKDTPYCTTLTLTDAGTYYLGSATNGIKIYKIVVQTAGGSEPGPGPVEPEPEGPDNSVPATIWVVGDSTVSSFSDTYYIPRQGYGEQIKTYFNAEVYNLAKSGASSKDFVEEDAYNTLLKGGNGIPKLGDADTEGKFLIIGFGHNDEKPEDARYTNPNGDYKTEGSFAKSLYDNYIKPALDAGVTPVVVTPIARYNSTNTLESYNSASGHITKTTTANNKTYEGGDYAQAIRDMCDTAELKDKVILVDLTKATIELNVKMGDGAKWMHAFTAGQYNAEKKIVPNESSIDATHTSSYGAKMNAWLIGDLTRDTALNKHWRSKAQPTYESAFEESINKSYVVVEYTAPTEEQMQNSMWPVYTDATGRKWYGTVFGNVGGQNKITEENFIAEQNEDGSIRLQVKNGQGKISSDSDAFIYYYTRLKAGTIFTLTADAKVNSFDANDQVSYGLMARDDLYIDKNITSTMGDYVAAGTYKKGTVNNFGRKSGSLNNGPAPTKTYITAGDEASLKIVSNSDGFAMTWGENDPVSQGFDYPLTGVDSEYIYVGFYVTRNADITFSDVSLTIESVPDNPDNPDNPDDPLDPDDPDYPYGEVEPDDIPDDKEIPEGIWSAKLVVGNYEYTGKAVKPDVHVYDGKKRMVQGTDYTVTYKNNINAYEKGDKTIQIPTITIKGKGNYRGEETIEFEIPRISLADSSKVAANAMAVEVVTGRVKKTAPTVTYNGKKLTAGKEIDIVYPDDRAYTQEGEAVIKVVALATGNFKDSVDIPLRVLSKTAYKNNLAKYFKVTKIPTQALNGTSPVTPEPQVTGKSGGSLDKDKDYQLSYRNNTKAGTATLVITGIGEYAGTKEVKFKIAPTSLKKANVTFVNAEGAPYDFTQPQPYMGAKITLAGFGVKAGDTLLTANKDYKLVYSGNNKAGNAYVTVQGIGNYSGSIKKKFKITAFNLNGDDTSAIGGDFAKNAAGEYVELIAPYQKGGAKPQVKLLINGNEMTAGVDYTIAYKNNTTIEPVNGKLPTVTIKGKGGLKGTLTRTFTIGKQSLTEVEVTAADVTLSKLDGKYETKIVLTDCNGKRLTAGKDYDRTVQYALVTDEKDENGEPILEPLDPVEGSKTITLGASRVAYIKATIKTAGEDSNYTGETSVVYRVGLTANSISKKAKVNIDYGYDENGNDKKYFDYTGSEVELKKGNIIVTIPGIARPLTYGTDFELINYTNNIKKGTARVTIKGLGRYTGTKTITYRIGTKPLILQGKNTAEAGE